MELGRRVHRWASTADAGRHGASRVDLGSGIHNAFRSVPECYEGRRRKAVYSARETEIVRPPIPWSNSATLRRPARRVHSRPRDKVGQDSTGVDSPTPAGWV